MGLWSLVQRGRGRLYDARWLMRMMLAMGPMGFVALVSGWFTTEVGRQPYTIYGLLRTADSVSPIASPAVGASLIAFVVVYLTVFGAGMFYIFRLLARWPGAEPAQPEIPPIRSAGITPAAAVVEHRGP